MIRKSRHWQAFLGSYVLHFVLHAVAFIVRDEVAREKVLTCLQQILKTFGTTSNHFQRSSCFPSQRSLAIATREGLSTTPSFISYAHHTSGISPCHPKPTDPSNLFIPAPSHILMTTSRTALTSSCVAPKFIAPLR
jgi:hypothetical protein